MYFQAIYQKGVFLFFRNFLSHMESIGGTKRKVGVAEREGFEPSVRLPAHVISSHAPSATRSSLRSRNSPPKNRFSELPILTIDTYPCKLFAKLSSHLEIPSRSLACDTFTGFVC